MIRMKLAGAGLSALIGAFALCGAAAAQPTYIVEGQADLPRILVGYGDLNLASDEGVEALNARVRGAAKRLCIANGTVPLPVAMAGRQCLRHALDDAGAQIASAVTDYGTTRFARRGGIEVALRK